MPSTDPRNEINAKLRSALSTQPDPIQAQGLTEEDRESLREIIHAVESGAPLSVRLDERIEAADLLRKLAALSNHEGREGEKACERCGGSGEVKRCDCRPGWDGGGARHQADCASYEPEPCPDCTPQHDPPVSGGGGVGEQVEEDGKVVLVLTAELVDGLLAGDGESELDLREQLRTALQQEGEG